ncbi:efflux RND transporter permease subunit [Shouchella shacheensis]|uniref:efflux RND transporter permease subunit n=1 Tax=Shouchella shacheensis TaxID=1649580 RepID=UPI0007403A92|nr:efflux RND transporter permease subunit [Shouchella shacheensis]
MTNFSIRRPIFTIVGMIFFIILGIVSVTRIPLQLLPEIDPPVAAVATSYTDVNPQEVEQMVTVPIENTLSTISGLESITSNTQEGSSIVVLEFDWSSSIEDVELDINNALRQLDLPDGAGEPSFLKFDPSMMPMMQLAVTSGDQVIDFQDEVMDLEQEIQKIPGVASVDESGTLTEEVQINLDREALADANVNQETIIGALQANNVSLPGGLVERDDLSLTTRVLSEVTSLEEIRDLVVGTDPEIGDEITINDVATVEITTADEETLTRANQEPAINLSVMQESEANTTQTSNAVNERLDELLGDSDYEDLDVVTLYDEGDFINQSLASVSSSLVAGGVLAMLVLFFFLRNFKTPLIIGLAIPFSIVVTFAFMFFANIGINIMTLGGLALGVGLVIDNAIVVIENIYRHLSKGKTPKLAALDGTKEVLGAITASTLTTISVFLPIVFISGIVGNLFQELALTVSFSLLSSLFVAITVVPMIASRVLKEPREDRESKRRESKSMLGLKKLTEWSLGHRKTVIGLVVVMLGLGGLGLTTVGTELIPDSDQGSFTVDIEMETGTSLTRTTETVDAVENVLDDHQEVSDYVSIVGSAGMMAGGSEGSHTAQMMVSMTGLEDRSISTAEFIESISRDLERADTDAEITASTQTAAMGSEANTVPFTLSYTDREELYDTAYELEEELLDDSLITDVELSIEDQAPEILIEVDEEAARENNLTPADIGGQVGEATRGQQAATVQISGDDEESTQTYDVMVQLDASFTESVEELEDLLLSAGDEGETVTLSEVAEITEGESPASIQRSDQEEAVEFTVSFSTNSTLSDVTAVINETTDDVELPDGMTFSYGGEQEILEDAIGSMVTALILAIVFIYLIMAAQFESFRLPFIMMLTVPLVVIGVALALTLTQTPIGVTTFIGIIILVGIVVNNGIVLLDFVNQQKEKGMGTYDALVESVQLRTRPILMTTVTTVLGMIPLSLGIGEGAELQQPMAIAVIGGLISGTILTLVVIPVIYSLIDKETRSKHPRYVTVDGEFYEVDDRRLPKEQEKLSDAPEKVGEEEAMSYQEAPSQEEGTNAEEEEPRTGDSPKAEELSKEDILKLLESIVTSSKKDDNDNKKE